MSAYMSPSPPERDIQQKEGNVFRLQRRDYLFFFRRMFDKNKILFNLRMQNRNNWFWLFLKILCHRCPVKLTLAFLTIMCKIIWRQDSDSRESNLLLANIPT